MKVITSFVVVASGVLSEVDSVPLRFALAFLMICPMAAPAAEQTFGGDFGPVHADILIPDAKVVRGVIVHAMNTAFKTDDRWAALGQELGFAHVVMSIDRKANNRPDKLAAALGQCLKEFGAKSGHPELVGAPRVGVGHSAGGMVISVLIRDPATTLTTCVDCSWVTDPTKLDANAKGVPMLFSMGAIPDGFKMLPAIEQHFVPARKEGLPWGMGVQWDCAHDFGNAATLMIPWIKAVVRLRLDPAADASKPVALRPIKLEDGWLGDRTSTDGTFAAIAAWADYKGDRAAASWFPDRATASVWRAWQTKKSPVVLEAAAADGSAKIPAFNPKKSRDLSLAVGTDIKLSVSAKPETRIRKVTYFAGDQPIAEAAAAPWEALWKNAPPGCHPVYAQWVDSDDKPGVSNPALVRVGSAQVKKDALSKDAPPVEKKSKK